MGPCSTHKPYKITSLLSSIPRKDGCDIIQKGIQVTSRSGLNTSLKVLKSWYALDHVNEVTWKAQSLNLNLLCKMLPIEAFWDIHALNETCFFWKLTLVIKSTTLIEEIKMGIELDPSYDRWRIKELDDKFPEMDEIFYEKSYVAIKGSSLEILSRKMPTVKLYLLNSLSGRKTYQIQKMDLSNTKMGQVRLLAGIPYIHTEFRPGIYEAMICIICIE